ncbi:MAG: VOC family protein [Pseudomonadota bacterium]
MDKTSVANLGYLEIGATDLGHWKSYAEEVLGVETIQDADVLHLRYDEDPWRIRISPTGEDDITCAGFEVDSVAALHAIRDQLAAQGVEVVEADEHARQTRGVDVLLRCQDPAGLTVELYVGARPAPPGAFSSPVGGQGFLTGKQGLGHMVLSAPDSAATERFYMDGLGFRLSDHIFMGPPGRQVQLTFLHCNPRHHTLALVPLAVPKRLNHIMLQVNDLDDVGRALDRARAGGVEITSSLGKHTNDHMISFYMKTPSGFEIEYGFGGREIDDATWETTSYNATSIWGHKP